MKVDMRSAWLLLVLLPIAWCGLSRAPSVACDTPVYRYAMYRWPPAPYEVYCFHEGELNTAASEVKAAIDAAGSGEQGPANVFFLPIDLAKDKELATVPPDIKEAWDRQPPSSLPTFLVSSPVGVHLSFGPLTAEEVGPMTDSPARRQIGRLLEEGHAGVYVLLEGENAEANTEAEQTLLGVVDDVAAGKVTLYSLPPVGASFAAGGEEQEDVSADGATKLSVGLVQLARNDARERWLIDCLLALDRDLRSSAEPIVFMVYGRGRALFSCLGKGIHRDNLIQDIEFVSGACSCTVKEQNPGVDLLMCYDWESAAETLSQQHGAEEGSPYEFAGDALFPELIIPSEGTLTDPVTPPPSAPTDDPSSVAEAAPAGESSSSDDDATDRSGTTTPAAQQEAHASAVPSASESPGTPIASTAPSHTSQPPTLALTEDTDPPGAFRGITWVAAGLLGALVLLFGITFVVLRPR